MASGGASQGRAYCTKGNYYLVGEGDSNQRLLKQCRACDNIIYVGCPGFKSIKTGDKKTRDWIRWWYYDIPSTSAEEPPFQTIMKCPASA